METLDLDPKSIRRLPAVKSLFDIIPKGTEGGKEFARVVNLLLFHEARRSGRVALLFDDSAGDFRGLDSFEAGFRKDGTTGYQYKFYPSPLSFAHRKEIERSVEKAAYNQEQLELKRWVLVTPQDLLESSLKARGGDVAWFESLRRRHSRKFQIEHWGHTKLLGLFLDTPALCLYYYPELVDTDRSQRKSIADTRNRYDKNLITLYSDIQFVGMPVYKPEASRGVAIHEIYIPLKIVPEEIEQVEGFFPRQNPLALLDPGSKHVVLGDPGSGKSTLLRFLALSGMSKALQLRYDAKPDNRLPIVVVLRKYADELKVNADLSLLDYIIRNIQADFSLRSADLQFFEYYLESGQAVLLFDGLDELPSPDFKEIVRDRIRSFALTYPGNTTVITSRIVGYDNPFRFDEKQYGHFRLSALQLEEIEQFVKDWYRVRIDNKAERDRSIGDLIRILKDDDNTAIRHLAENPLLLTIVALVHRIDAVLPDERVVLYQKCTETLLNTWHTWKFRESEQKNRLRLERRNRARMEAIAHWMQCKSEETGKFVRAVVPYRDLHSFLASFIAETERTSSQEMEHEDSATDFLKFVRKRAGLLIEAGDQQYSFVHLTFQEYLTASHIITANETAGAAGLWSTVESYCRNPRWHEVIRLLMGGLRSPSSQAALLQHLLEAKNASDPYVAELLGGFLLDGIEAAEEKLKEILFQLTKAAADAKTLEECRRLTRILRALTRRDNFDVGTLKSVLQTRIKEVSTRGQIATLLIAPASGMNESWMVEQCINTKLKEADEYLFKILFAPSEQMMPPRSARPKLDQLFDFAAFCLVSSSLANAAAARLDSLFWRAGYSVAAEYSFHLLLASFIGGEDNGPFAEFALNLLRLANPGQRINPKRDHLELTSERFQGAFKRLWPYAKKPRNGDEKHVNEGFWVGRETLGRRLAAHEGGERLKQTLISVTEGRKSELSFNRFPEILGPETTSFLVDTIPIALGLSPVA